MTERTVAQTSITGLRGLLITLTFIAGNMALPMLCHALPGGGPTWLPIYFFSLIAGWMYGWRMGLAVALLSPVLNSLFTGMPMVAMLPIICIKGSLLAVAASLASRHIGLKLWAVACAILACQGIGFFAEWALSGSAMTALQDIRMGWPGLLVQLLGGYAGLRALTKE